MAAASELPHAVCVELARDAIAAGPAAYEPAAAAERAHQYRRSLLAPVINATGVLLHTNLGRAPLALTQSPQATNVEFDLETGERGSRQTVVGGLLATLCGAEAAMVVNNNAASVLLVLAALANGRDVLVSRGESVEIGGGFRVPEVIEQSGARLLDVGTTNRTRLADYSRAISRRTSDVALVLKVHPGNYRVEGFTEGTSIEQLATLSVPIVADIGSGLIDANCPWLSGPPPAWLATEPAARQTLAAGAALVTFSGDKLFGGPQAGIIAGRADLVAACGHHPLARALRPGIHILLALQQVALAYLQRAVVSDSWDAGLPFWQMATASVNELSVRAHQLVATAGCGAVVATESVPGAGSAPGTTIASVGVSTAGDHLAALRRARPPIIARTRDGVTVFDLRTVNPADDGYLVEALRACAS
ncbi:MAG: L-seryl-tRNA(Sec) selenium transferase [Actinobacteria bacterium]|nr:L-seryl-tRNA(Sec) selenium transferase [Actinomycetota bacterium]